MYKVYNVWQLFLLVKLQVLGKTVGKKGYKSKR